MHAPAAAAAGPPADCGGRVRLPERLSPSARSARWRTLARCRSAAHVPRREAAEAPGRGPRVDAARSARGRGLS